MNRTQLLEAMRELQLRGTGKAYDEVMDAALKRGHKPQRILGDLPDAEIAEKKARSIKCRMTIAKLPPAKELDEFNFKAAAVEEGSVRSLAEGAALDLQRNAVPVGGTGTGRTHLAVGLARFWIRAGRRGRFFNTVDLVNRLDAEARAERPGRTAEAAARLDFVVPDEPG